MYYIASDHAGFEVKNNLKDKMRMQGIHLVDLGPTVLDPGDDYPLYALDLAQEVAGDVMLNKGILICSSGAGMVIAANKVKGVRAAEIANVDEAVLSRQHNDANVLVLSKLALDYELYTRIIKVWLTTPFSFEERHLRRIKEITDYEGSTEFSLPQVPEVSQEAGVPQDAGVP